MVHGLMEMIRPEFAQALSVFKGGDVGVAEIRRMGRDGTSREVIASDPAEMVRVHYEALDSEGADALGYDLTGTQGRRVFFDELLEVPVADGDVLIFAGDTREWQVGARISEPGNNTPNDSVAVILR